MENNYKVPEEIGRWRAIALGVGGIGTLVLLITALVSPDLREQFFRSWLLGYIFWCGIGVGSLGILLLQYVTGGAWGVIIRRVAEASSRTLPILVILFIPLVIGTYTNSLYEWTHPAAGDEILQHRAPYLNFTNWTLRAFLYFGLWAVMMVLLNKWSKDVEDTGDWSILQKISRFSGPTMVFFVLVVTFAAIDWVMTIDPHFFSTIWGLLFVASWGLSAFTFSVVILAWLSDRAPLNRVIGKRHFHDIGKLILALVMVWAYFNFSQFLIIWSGNIPEETFWYIKRMENGWGVIGIALIVLHFAFPFLVLLSRDLKRNAKWLAALAVFILLVRFIDLYYMIGPAPRIALHGEGLEFLASLSWMDFVAPFAVGGLWLWYFFGELQKRPLVPVNDPFLEPAIEHGRGH